MCLRSVMGTVPRIGLLILLVLPTVICQTDFKCFTCFSNDDHRCGDNFQPMVPTYFCPGSCLKFRGERWSKGVRVVEVNRMCGTREDEGCWDGVEYNGISTRKCVCNENMCNHGNRNLVPSILVTIGLFTARIVFT